MDVDPELVDQVLPQEGRDEVGPAQGEVAAGLRPAILTEAGAMPDDVRGATLRAIGRAA